MLGLVILGVADAVGEAVLGGEVIGHGKELFRYRKGSHFGGVVGIGGSRREEADFRPAPFGKLRAGSMKGGSGDYGVERSAGVARRLGWLGARKTGGSETPPLRKSGAGTLGWRRG